MGSILISCRLEPSGKQNVVQWKIRHVDSSCSLSLFYHSLCPLTLAVGIDSGLSSRTGSDKCGCIIGTRLQFSPCES